MNAIAKPTELICGKKSKFPFGNHYKDTTIQKMFKENIPIDNKRKQILMIEGSKFIPT